jgi:CheY-like chemotaxis protein
MQFDTFSRQAKPSYRVLVAEDCPDSRMLISEMLIQSGLQVTAVCNGKECLEAGLEAWEQSNPFDVILMDIQMPEMDGHAAARMLRANGYTLPIVAMTARSTLSDEDNTYAAGCNAHISKLSGGTTLVAEVIKQVEANPHAVKKVPSQIPLLPVVPELLKKHPEYARSALSLIEKLPKISERIHRYAQEGNYDAIKIATVELGSAPMLGYSILGDYLKELQCAAESKSMGQLSSLLPKLERVIQEIIAGKNQVVKIAEQTLARH